jgi:hypothetical protein
MNTFFNTAAVAAALVLSTSACAQITFYEHEGFRGRVHTTRGALDNFAGWDFNNRASSVVVEKGRWEVCEGIGFTGRCAVLRPGSYDRLSTMGLNDRLSSVRPAKAGGVHANEAPPPMRRPDYAYRQRPNETLFEAPVTFVRAVHGAPDRRCWVERQGETRGTNGSPGIMGHQIGGSTLGRCPEGSNGTLAYWEVGYSFRGTAHRIQMNESPGPTVTVNRRGEPRM